MLKELNPGLRMMVVLTVLTGFIYPAFVTVLSQVLFRDQANGSLIVVNGQVVGSRLIGQNFTKPEYFQPRPSAAGSGYDPTATAGTNLGPTSAKLINSHDQRRTTRAKRSPTSRASKTGSSTTATTTASPTSRLRLSIWFRGARAKAIWTTW